MNLGDVIQKATAGIVPQLIGGEKGFARSTVTTTRNERTRDAAARPVTDPAPGNPIQDAKWLITEIADGHVQRVWGVGSEASAEATVPLSSDVADNDVVTVTAGDFAGNVYEVEQIRRIPLGNVMKLALVPTGQPSE